MDHGPTGSPPAMNAEKLQEALRAFGSTNGATPPSTGEMAALVQRLGVPMAAPGGQAAVPGPPTMVGPQYVFVILGDMEMAWPAAQVVGVERLVDITPVPLTKAWVLGVANVRGTITSVVDLRLFLGLPRQTPTARSRVVVASTNGMTIGFLVDGVNEFRVIPPEVVNREAVRQMVPPWLTPYAEGVALLGNRRIITLAVERLLFAEALHQYRSDTSYA